MGSGKGDPERLRAGLDHLDLGVAIFDADLRLVEFNRPYVEVLGYPPDWVRPGTAIEDLIRFNARRGGLGTVEIEDYVREVLARITSGHADRYDRTLPTGEILEVRRFPLSGGGIFNTYADVTERRKAENELRRRAQIIDEIRDSVISTDLDGIVTSWNRGSERLFGYAADEAIGRHISFVYPEEEHEYLQNDIIAPLKEKGMHEVEVGMRRKSGEDFISHLALSLQTDGSGKVVGMLGYSMDITGHVRAEVALRKARDDLELRVAERTRELTEEM